MPVAVPRLHLIVDLTVSPETVDAAVEGGVDAVHLRDHAASAADLLRHGCALRATIGQRAMLVINDRIDVALALGADAVQVGGRSLPVDVVRRIAPGLLIGASIHSVGKAVLDADWLLIGTIYASRSHPGRPGAGAALIASAAAATRTPLIAIGGIDAANAHDCVVAGAHGVAVISAIAAAVEPRAAAAALRKEIER